MFNNKMYQNSGLNFCFPLPSNDVITSPIIGNLRANANNSGNIFPNRFNKPNISHNIPNRGRPVNTNTIPNNI
jgi:hypothetical protein